MDKEVLLEVRGINKSFSTTKALKSVDIKVYRGEVRGLIGENGSGKSTLSGVIFGTVRKDEGEMFINGEPYAPTSPLDAGKNKVSMIVQEMGTIPGITVAANLFLGREDMFAHCGIVNVAQMRKMAKACLQRIGVDDIAPECLVDSLSFEDRKMVEIAKAMDIDPEILIVDETTTALSQKGREILYKVIGKIKQNNGSAIFISHDLDEMVMYCDSLTVMRDGNVVDTVDAKKVTQHEIKQLMVGREISDEFYRADFCPDYEDEVVLKVENLAMTGVVSDFNLDLHKGEILGIGGLTDCGMHEIGKLIFGLLKPDCGGAYYTGNNKRVELKNPSICIENKIGYMSKNRDTEALMLISSIKDNICLPSLDKIKRNEWISHRAQRDLAKEFASQMNVKMRDIDQYCLYLSGGNKQKVVIAKWLSNDTNIFIMDCPTRGIDVGVKAAIYKMMEGLKKQGASIIMISEELPELIGMSDRLMVLKNGKVNKVFDRSRELTEKEVIQYMI